MVISNAKVEDAKSLALLHKKVFGEIHFTTSFYVSMLTKYFENLIEKMEYGIVIRDNGDLVGYLFAGSNIEKIINNFLKKYFVQISFYLLRNPRFILEKVLEFTNSIKLKSKQADN